MRIAVLTLEALAAARAVRRFVASDPSRIALVGLSDPFRPEAGGSIGQTARRLRASGPGILPYLFLNFSAPRLAGALLPGPADDDVERVPLRRTCARLGIPVEDVPDANTPAFRERLRDSGADLLLTFHVDQIVSAETVAVPRLGGINVHAALLPLHRGPVPTIHALLDDPVRLGVTIHRLAPRIDAGAVLAQVPVEDNGRMSALEAAARCHEEALPLLDLVLGVMEAGMQDEEIVPVLPYRGFPSPAELRRLRRKGRRAAGWRDALEALRVRV